MRLTFYSRLILAYGSILFALLFGAAAWFLGIQAGRLENELRERKRAFFGRLAAGVDTRASVALNVVGQILANQDLREYARGVSVDYFAMRRLQVALAAAVDAFADFGFQVAVARATEEPVVTPRGTIAPARFFDELGLSDYQVEAVSDLFYGASARRGRAAFRGHGSIFGDAALVTVAGRELVDSGYPLVFFITFLESEFLPSDAMRDRELFLLLDEDRLLSFGGKLSEKEIYDLVATESVASLASRAISGEPVHAAELDLFSSDSAAFPGRWRYVYASPRDSLSHAFREASMVALAMFGVLAALAATAVLLVSKALYRPIASAVHRFDDLGARTPGEDEFDFIRKSADRLFGINELLSREAEANRRALELKFLRDLLVGTVDAGIARERLAAFGLERLDSGCSLALLEYASYHELEECFDKDELRRLREFVLKFVRDRCADSSSRVFEFEDRRIALLLAGDETDARRFLGQLLAGIEARFDLTLAAALPARATRIEELRDRCQEAAVLLEHRYAAAKRVVVSAEDLPRLVRDAYYYPIEIERSLENDVLKLRRDRVAATIDSLLAQNLDKRSLSRGILSQFLFALCATLSRIVQRVRLTDGEIFGEGRIPYLELKDLEDPGKIRAAVPELFFRLMDCVQRDSRTEDDEIAERLMDYVEANCENDLSLQDLGEHFNLSPSYIGVLFKSATGENFKEYLNHHRVELAKRELAADPKLSISALAARLGCNSANTFIRIFKRYEGLSPGEYQRRAAADGS